MPYGGSTPKTTTLAERLAAQGQPVPEPVQAAPIKRAPFSMVDSVAPTRPVLVDPQPVPISTTDTSEKKPLCELSVQREEMLKRCIRLGDGFGLCKAAVNALPGPELSEDDLLEWYDVLVEMKKNGQLSPTELLRCVDCGQPRSVGSAAQCRKCYQAHHQRERRAATTELTVPPAPSPAFKIEKGVPLPLANQPAKYLQYPWNEMEVGDSFFVPGMSAAAMASMARCGGTATGRKFTCRQSSGGARVWRIA